MNITTMIIEFNRSKDFDDTAPLPRPHPPPLFDLSISLEVVQSSFILSFCHLSSSYIISGHPNSYKGKVHKKSKKKITSASFMYVCVGDMLNC